MQTLRDKAYFPIYADKRSFNRIKITIVGADQVGMATAFSLLIKGIPNEVAIIDLDVDRVEAEVQDLASARQFLPKSDIYGGSNFKLSSNSNIVIICTGISRSENETNINHIQRNVDAFKSKLELYLAFIFAGLVPHIVENSPKCMIIVLTKPVDVMAYVAWRISGFPKNRVFGLGTMLDSARFRIAIGQKLGLNANMVHAYIFGEQGERAVPIWSTLAIAGAKLRSIYPEIGTNLDKEGYVQIPSMLVETEKKIIAHKGSSSWALGLAASLVCEAILGDSDKIYTISTHAKHEGKLMNKLKLEL
ncbi:unnamed protein product [Protopolystoma xenopodis]|uniref:L-lactate dehydrogenase n=1 Tax=Protopolystoma xenopodis TaxID=117903 RepID=A0A448XF47_9PLAT|nr:unnamed protein product [Protopolystoma xenopodis]